MEYETPDIILAAALKVHRFKLTKSQRVVPDHPRVSFTFEYDNLEQIDTIINKFMLGQMLVEPTEFYNSIRQLSAVAKSAK